MPASQALRRLPLALCAAGAICAPAASSWALWGWGAAAALGTLSAIGVRDLLQRKHSINRNYPILGHLRYLLEKIRPEIRQYFLEADTEAAPFSRNQRSLAYQRAKGQIDKAPFGTQRDLYADHYEWMTHSMAPKPASKEGFRVAIGEGNPGVKLPYHASVFNISAMSFGSLSANAILALNKGAAAGGFYHDTGEGSISEHHRVHGGDLVWEIGSGYFGCRNADGSFSEEAFAKNAASPQVRMIEIKLSQGAKPGHGGILPGRKVSIEIAAARGVEPGADCVSPPAHSAFSDPIGLLEFIGRLRTLSGGKPVGFKLCVGHAWEWLAIARAMQLTGMAPDFIVVDGAEGGTGAAPVEFADHMGMPLAEGLRTVDSTLRGIGMRARVKVGASGKIISGFDIARAIANGADWCNSARGFMFALGCIQSMACHTDRCPTGVATQDPTRSKALDVDDKARRVESFHKATVGALAELIAAAGLEHPSQIEARHLMVRGGDGKARPMSAQFDRLQEGSLLGEEPPDVEPYKSHWKRAQPGSFEPAKIQ